MQIASGPSGGFKIQHGFIFLRRFVQRSIAAMRMDLQKSVMLDPNLAYDDVVHAAIDVVPRVDLSMVEEFDGEHPLRLHFEGFAPKADFGRDASMEFPVGRLSVKGGDWRVVRDLNGYTDKMG